MKKLDVTVNKKVIKRKSKPKKSSVEHSDMFWLAPAEAFFGQETISAVMDISIKTLECNRWRGVGLPFRKVMGRVLYRKCDVISFIESYPLTTKSIKNIK